MIERTSEDRYCQLLDKVPRRTNDCWLGDLSDKDGVYVCGHKFLLRMAGTSLAIWRLIDGKHTLLDIVGELSETYIDSVHCRIREDVIEVLLRLEALGLAAWRTRPLLEDVEYE